MDVLSPTLTKATRSSLARYQTFKVLLTLGLLGYAVTLTIFAYRAKDKAEQDALEFTRSVWFGDSLGVIQIIISLWIFFFVLQIGQPVLQYVMGKLR